MKKYLFKNGIFVKTALLPKDYPQFKDGKDHTLSELAIIGRSNVGKSTLINHLFQSKGLAKTSTRPGKTQAINFFTINQQFVVVDLPGYGFADVNQNLKKNWGKTIDTYLNQREYLGLLLFLLDIRRMPSEEDMQMRNWIVAKNIPFIVIFTKVDKVGIVERQRQTQAILRTLSFTASPPFVHYSAINNEGRKQLIHLIHTCLN